MGNTNDRDDFKLMVPLPKARNSSSPKLISQTEAKLIQDCTPEGLLLFQNKNSLHSPAEELHGLNSHLGCGRE